MRKQFKVFLTLSIFVVFNFVLISQVHAETEVSGNISTDITWTLANSPYIVTGTIQVLDGVTLTIEPGVEVKFNSATGINIGGELIAEGTANNIITFTSSKSTPKAGDWYGIKFFDTAIGANFDSNYNYINGSAIRYSKIAYATYAPGYSGSTAALNSGSIPLLIDNCIIEFSQYNAIFINASKSKISNNIIRANSLGHSKTCNDGIVSIYSDDFYIENNTIDNNGDIGIDLHSSNNHVLNNKITNNGCGIKVYGSKNEILSNMITGNYFAGISYYGGISPGFGNIIMGNTITQNQDSGIYAYKYNALGVEITKNNIYNNTNYNFKYDDSFPSVDMPNNYWGATDNTSIANKIYDYYDNISLGKVIYEPYALAELKFDGTDIFSQSATCTSWTYSDWSICQSDGTQTRTINSSSPNGCSGGNPILTQSCTYTSPVCTSWTYSAWGSCVDSQQTRTITSSQPTNCTGGTPILNQSCNSTPLCMENNWTLTLTPTNCSNNGQQTKIWNKIGQCQGGTSHPSEETVSCNNQATTCTSFTYSSWGLCNSSGVQSRTKLYSSPSDCIGGNPVLNQSCKQEVKIENADDANNINQTVGNINPNSSTNKIESQKVIAEEKKLITKIDNNLSKRVSGNILLQVEKNGEGWYIYPDDNKKYYLGRPADAFSIMRNLDLGIKHSELTNYLNAKFPSKLSGKILLDVEKNGEAYYVNPKDLKGYFLNRPADAFKVMRELGLGITNVDIRKIGVGEIK